MIDSLPFPDSPESISDRCYRYIAYRRGGATVADLLAHLDLRDQSRLVSAVCRQMVKYGYLVMEQRPKPGERRLVNVYRVSGKPRRPKGIRATITEPLRTALDAHGPQTLAQLVARVGASRKATHGALAAMMAGGEVQRVGAPNAWRYALADIEEEAWTPPPYVPALRAQILGLKRAA